jgi:L-ectoine synthase
MKVKSIKNVRQFEPDRCVTGVGFESVRVLLARDGMGFSLHKTIIPKGGPYNWHYKHHFEACYCVSGIGELVNLETGERFVIEPETTYILDNHDNHTFEAIEDIVLISVFNPPVTGNEVHQSDGSYAVETVENTCGNCFWE